MLLQLDIASGHVSDRCSYCSSQCFGAGPLLRPDTCCQGQAPDAASIQRLFGSDLGKLLPVTVQAGLAAASSLAWCFLNGLVSVSAHVLQQVPPALLVRLLHHLTQPATTDTESGTVQQLPQQVSAGAQHSLQALAAAHCPLGCKHCQQQQLHDLSGQGTTRNMLDAASTLPCKAILPNKCRGFCAYKAAGPYFDK